MQTGISTRREVQYVLYLKGGCKLNRARIFTVVLSDRIKGNGNKGNGHRKIHTVQVTEIFKNCLYAVLGNLL